MYLQHNYCVILVLLRNYKSLISNIKQFAVHWTCKNNNLYGTDRTTSYLVSCKRDKTFNLIKALATFSKTAN